MPNTREKLIELIRMPVTIFPDAVISPHITFTLPYAEDLADHLIANGVTIPVRCKDCRKCHTHKDFITGQPVYKCRLWNGSSDVDADMFCDAGERWMPLPEKGE